MRAYFRNVKERWNQVEWWMKIAILLIGVPLSPVLAACLLFSALMLGVVGLFYVLCG